MATLINMIQWVSFLTCIFVITFLVFKITGYIPTKLSNFIQFTFSSLQAIGSIATVGLFWVAFKEYRSNTSLKNSLTAYNGYCDILIELGNELQKGYPESTPSFKLDVVATTFETLISIEKHITETVHKNLIASKHMRLKQLILVLFNEEFNAHYFKKILSEEFIAESRFCTITECGAELIKAYNRHFSESKNFKKECYLNSEGNPYFMLLADMKAPSLYYINYFLALCYRQFSDSLIEAIDIIQEETKKATSDVTMLGVMTKEIPLVFSHILLVNRGKYSGDLDAAITFEEFYTDEETGKIYWFGYTGKEGRVKKFDIPQGVFIPEEHRESYWANTPH